MQFLIKNAEFLIEKSGSPKIARLYTVDIREANDYVKVMRPSVYSGTIFSLLFIESKYE